MAGWQGPLPEELWRYRTAWPRFLAGLVDSLVLAPMMYLDWKFAEMRLSGVAAVAWMLVYQSAVTGYSIGCHAVFGATLGKRAIRLIVLDMDGNIPGWRRAALRDAVPTLLFIPSLVMDIPRVWDGMVPYRELATSGAVSAWDGYAGIAIQVWFWSEIVTMLFNEKRRALHDYIAGTVVIRTDPS